MFRPEKIYQKDVRADEQNYLLSRLGARFLGIGTRVLGKRTRFLGQRTRLLGVHGRTYRVFFFVS